MTTAPPEDIRALEQTRQRLVQLSNSLASLRRELETRDPLPDWDSIEKSSTLLYHNMRALQTTVSGAAGNAATEGVLRAAHAYPTPAFPGRAQEAMLSQLLRKRLEPRVEDWVEEGRKAAAASSEGEGAGEERRRLNASELAELWDWAAPHANDVAKKILFEGEEGEEEEEDDDDEEDGGAMEGVEKTEAAKEESVAVPLDSMLRFMSTGVVPKA